MKTVEELKDTIIRNCAVRDSLKSRIKKSKKELKRLLKQEEHAKKAQLILQTIAKETQKQLEYRIGELGSLSLAAVFDDPYTMKLSYVAKRNKTEAQIKFERDGREIDPLFGGGHGAVDIASFSLRCSTLSLANPPLDNVIIMDEPFKNINDDTRQLHVNAANMVKEVSDKLGIQFIITSQIPELREIADKVFKVVKKNGVSTVKEV